MISMLINATEKEETRIAVVENGRLDEFSIERSSRETLVGNIYKGKVENIHPALQAAFVSIGLERNGFLHASETRPQEHFYSAAQAAPSGFPRGGMGRRRRSPRFIQDALRPGQEIIVQVTRDGFGEKGPSVTMDISLPGRFLVLTPTLRHVGVSKKIEDRATRNQLRELLRELAPPSNIGFIIRTTGTDTTKADFKADLSHLLRVWSAVIARATNTPAPSPLYQEAELTIRTVRDVFSKQTDEIVVDHPIAYRRLLDFFANTMMKYQERVKYYSGSVPLFGKYGVEKQIDELNQKTVRLPSGGTIVIEQTEALTAIDVNSGRYTREFSPEETAFRTNSEAAAEVIRQLRLRDLGGIMVIDFIDMELLKHRRSVEEILFREARRDKSQMTILPMSPFCIVEIARQKIRPSLHLVSSDPCPTCKGLGFVKNFESLGLEVIRLLRTAIGQPDAAVVDLNISEEIARFLDTKKGEIEKLEHMYSKRVHVNVNKSLSADNVELNCYNSKGEKLVDIVR